jgi:hypothetical protein
MQTVEEIEVLSRHPFRKPHIRLWLPLIMLGMLFACIVLAAPTIRPIELVGVLFLLYVAISALVSVGEITVLENGLIIHRLLLPERTIPWSAIDRVLVYTHEDGQRDVHVEIASIGIYEGLSPLNRLPGLIYGQGLRQTIVISPDALEDYDDLLKALEEHCTVIRKGVFLHHPGDIC